MAAVAGATGAWDHHDGSMCIEDPDRVCWICLGEEGELEKPCRCPHLYAHKACRSAWQLRSAGKEEERHCRFCHAELPDWRPALTPESLQPKPSVMSVRYKGVTHRIQYTPGPGGLEQFLATLQSIGIKVASANQVTFLCRSPDTGSEVALRGLGAFDAAAYCASITAAKRLQQRGARRARSSGGGGCGGDAAGAAAAAPAPAPLSSRRMVAHVHAESLASFLEGSSGGGHGGSGAAAEARGRDDGSDDDAAAPPDQDADSHESLPASPVSSTGPFTVLDAHAAAPWWRRRAPGRARGRSQERGAPLRALRDSMVGARACLAALLPRRERAPAST